MLTRHDALFAHEFHFSGCTKTVGPRGGVQIRREIWRRNGDTRTWKREPNRFRIPIKYGMGYGKGSFMYITDDTAYMWHTSNTCPLNERIADADVQGADTEESNTATSQR